MFVITDIILNMVVISWLLVYKHNLSFFRLVSETCVLYNCGQIFCPIFKLLSYVCFENPNNNYFSGAFDQNC